MNTTTAPAVTAPEEDRAPRKQQKGIHAARRILADRTKASAEVARLQNEIRTAESEHRRLTAETEFEQRQIEHRPQTEPNEQLADNLKEVGDTLEKLYGELEKQQALYREADQLLPAIAEDVLRVLHPPAVQTAKELVRLDEIEAELQAQKIAIERDCDPLNDEPKLKELESIVLRLSVLPGKRDRWHEKLAAQVAELSPFGLAGTYALSRRVRELTEAHRAKFDATIAPYFEDAKIPAVCEADCNSIFRETALAMELQMIEAEGCSNGRYGSDFNLAAVPPLLSAFDKLAKFPQP